jgi:hypothetical protein
VLKKIQTLTQYIYMRWFSSSKTFIKWYLNKNFGKVKLDDNTWAVIQSDEFYQYCYNEGYRRWKENNG